MFSVFKFCFCFCFTRDKTVYGDKCYTQKCLKTLKSSDPAVSAGKRSFLPENKKTMKTVNQDFTG